MNAHEVPEMPLSPLKAISPSGFVALRACPLRAVWAAHSPPLLPRHPSTRIGTVVHHLWEAAASGRVANEAEFDRMWGAEIEAQEKEMKQDWKEAHLVPLSTSVPDIEVRRLSWRRQLTGWRRGTGGGTYKAEHALSDVTGGVKGRIDVIMNDAEGAHLIDLKTGPVADTDGNIKDEYATQLKLYAALYHQNTGDWPVSLTLRTAEGVKCAILWSHEECVALLTEALHLRTLVNGMIEQDPRGGTLARPDPDTCRYCSFRPACPQYWGARETVCDEREWPSDAHGRVEQLTHLGNGRLKLRLVDDTGTVHLRGLSPDRQTFLDNHRAGAAFYGLRWEGHGRFVEGALTTGYSA